MATPIKSNYDHTNEADREDVALNLFYELLPIVPAGSDPSIKRSKIDIIDRFIRAAYDRGYADAEEEEKYRDAPWEHDCDCEDE